MKTTIKTGAIVKLLGRLVFIEAAIMILPLIVALIYGESQWKGFLLAIVAAAAAGCLAEVLTHRRDTSIRAREGFIVTALVWVIFAFFGMIPFLFSDSPLGVTDGMFEVISGLTTTGASVIPDVEVQPKCILFWRALTQWIGGLGIVLFMLAVLPELNKAVGISMFNAEATGITHTKLHPRI
ncbi:MAG: TrkH family potassium uptake protein, partial [Duncaniella sp.]|nr:TrkH family potassium uptake protein [Duncaniella sp.]